MRLADMRRHYEALGYVLERTTQEEFVHASRVADPEQLSTQVYPLERAFEILCTTSPRAGRSLPRLHPGLHRLDGRLGFYLQS